MKIYKELDATKPIQLKEGTYSGYQIETENYIFDFDIEIVDKYVRDAGSEFAPETEELVGREITIDNLTVWNKKDELFDFSGNEFLIDKIKTKFR